MVVKIRLARWGARNHPFYGIVIANARAARDKKHLERVGTYNPIPDANGVKHIEMKWDRIKYWLGVGAQPSDRVAWLLAKAELMPPTPKQLQREGKISLSDAKTWDVRMIGPDGKERLLSAVEARTMFEGKPEGEQL
ncbi:ribosomal protein S16 domain-containing protein, partial [Chytridium lagenaria]